ncbi:MAG TPA: hypothetical protein VGX91_04145 [Candidatus Cybelea sp.]|nr:hypothetical protein [Candidatus Cybelea sp.]
MTTPAVFYHHTALASSPATLRNFGIYNWLVELGNHQMDGVGKVDDVALLALDANGRVVWEVDSQSSQALGAIRFFFSSGGYFGAWTNGTLNVAQAPSNWDTLYMQALQKDVQWAQAGYPGGGGGIRRPISNSAPNGGPVTPNLSDGQTNMLIGLAGITAGALGMIGCAVVAPCGLIALGIIATTTFAGFVAVDRGAQQLEEASHPPTPIQAPHSIGESPSGTEFYGGYIVAAPLPPGGSPPPPSISTPPIPGMTLHFTIITTCDVNNVCSMDIAAFWE